jgi:hypothetical protein
MTPVVGLYYDPLARNSQRKGVGGRLYMHYMALLAPRDESYMRHIFEQRYPGASFLNAGIDGNWQTEIKTAEKIVLLFPDAIGFGFSRLEHQVRGLKSATAEVCFLNGRTRTLQISASVRSQLRLRRLLVRFLVFEMLAIVPFFFATLWFAGSDRVRGRK